MSIRRTFTFALPAFLAVMLAPAVLSDDKDTDLKEQPDREVSATNLRKLGIAMHYYHNDFKRLPFHAHYSKDGKPLLSWRVMILPYLEQKELHKQFKLDEPWDSEHNKKLLEKMPAVYAPVYVKPKEKYVTYYQVFSGPGAIFDGENPLTLGQLTVGDGSSNTVMIAEAAEPVLWTKPADLPFEKDKPMPKIGGLFKYRAHACAGDCSIWYIKKDIPENLLRQVVGYNDGGNEDTGEYVDVVKYYRE